MEFVVNGKVFTDIDEARKYEASLNKQTIKDIIENNTSIVKVSAADFVTYIVATVTNTDSKLAAYAFAERYFGKRYSLKETKNGVDVEECYSFLKMSKEEVANIKSIVYSFLEKEGIVRGDYELSEDKYEHIIFYNRLRDNTERSTDTEGYTFGSLDEAIEHFVKSRLGYLIL